MKQLERKKKKKIRRSNLIMKLRLKLIEKKTIYILYCIFILLVALLLDRFIQMLLFILLFNFIHNVFNYRFHSDTLYDDPILAVKICKAITIIVEIVYLIFCKELDVSIYSNLAIIFGICLSNCLLEFTIISVCKCKLNPIRKGINRETLIKLCKEKDFNDFETNIMIDYYCNNYKIDKIAFKYQYSSDNIKKIKSKLLKRLLN